MTARYERVGVTASRFGMCQRQAVTIRSALQLLRGVNGSKYLHHGDCVGGDSAAAQIARDLGFVIVGHPPTKDGNRAFFESDETRAPLGYLPRDRALVDEVDLLIGCPNTPQYVAHSGTWYTINYAMETGVKVAVIMPSGRWAVIEK